MTLSEQTLAPDETGERPNLQDQLEQNLHAAVELLERMLQLHHPSAGGHSRRVATAAEFIAIQMSMTYREVSDIRTGSLLHDIGKISVPQRILEKDPVHLNASEKSLIKEHSAIGDDLLRNMPAMEGPRKIIRHHHENFDGTGWPDRLSRQRIPVGSRIISVVDVYDKILHLPSASSVDGKKEFAVTHLNNNTGKLYDPNVVSIFTEFLDVKDMVDSEIMEVPVPIRGLKEGMVLARDIRASDSTLVLPRDTRIGTVELQRIAHHNEASPIVDPVHIYVE